MADKDKAKSPEALKDMAVSSSVLENIFGTTDRWIRKLADEGIVIRESHGKYMLYESIRNYITFLKVNNRKKTPVPIEGEVKDLDTERAEHEHIKRQISEIKLMLIKGQVHKAEDVEAVMTDMLERFKTRVLALPSKLAVKLERKGRVKIQKVLEEELHQCLNELGKYNAADFYGDEHIDVDMKQIDELQDGEE